MNDITHNSQKKFIHSHAAHCESGSIVTLLRNNDFEISEAMAFGLGEGLFFAYFPFMKIMGTPVVTYRNFPKSIIKNLSKHLGIKIKFITFKNKEDGKKKLDYLLEKNIAVGAQVSVYWLPYFPDEMRFHFNAHNLIIYGRDTKNNEYLISDSVFQNPVRIQENNLQKARFTKGQLAPKGLLYYPLNLPKKINYEHIIKKSITKTANRMLRTPIPYIGIKGMKKLAKHIGKLENKHKRYSRLFLGNIIRMQEEIGTGGAGFRFIYAAFLDEAGKKINNKILIDCAKEMLIIGDEFRLFASMIAKSIVTKTNTTPEKIPFHNIANKLLDLSAKEQQIYLKLKKAF
jgi:hypothetical protein